MLQPAQNIFIAAYDVNLSNGYDHGSHHASLEDSMYNAYHEECITEYYRQECLLALYKRKRTKSPYLVSDAEQHRISSRVCHSNKRKRKKLCTGVTFAETTHVVMGVADAEVDRTPVPASKITREEMMTLMAERVLPHTNIGHISRQYHAHEMSTLLPPSMVSMDHHLHHDYHHHQQQHRNFTVVR